MAASIREDPIHRTVQPLDLDAVRVEKLEDLPRLCVHELGAGIAKPADDRPVPVRVSIVLDGRNLQVRVGLRSHAVGLGRRWSAVCPCCGRGAAYLYLANRRLCCWRCSGARRLSEKLGHDPIYRTILRPLGRAGELQRRGQRRRIHRTTRERLMAEATRNLDVAEAGLRRLGVPAEDFAVVGSAAADLAALQRVKARV